MPELESESYDAGEGTRYGQAWDSSSAPSRMRQLRRDIQAYLSASDLADGAPPARYEDMEFVLIAKLDNEPMPGRGPKRLVTVYEGEEDPRDLVIEWVHEGIARGYITGGIVQVEDE